MPSKNRQERLVDFNILPEQYRPRKLPSRVLFLWLAAIGLTLLLVPTFRGAGDRSSGATDNPHPRR